MGSFRRLLSKLDSELVYDDVENLKFLCQPLIKQKKKLADITEAHQLFQLLEQQSLISPRQTDLLCQLLAAIERLDLQDDVVVPDSEASAMTKGSGSAIRVCPFHAMLLHLSENVNSEELHKLRFLCEIIPQKAQIKRGTQVFSYMMNKKKLSPANLGFLKEILGDVHREDLIEHVEQFEKQFVIGGVYIWEARSETGVLCEVGIGYGIPASESSSSIGSEDSTISGKLEKLNLSGGCKELCLKGPELSPTTSSTPTEGMGDNPSSVTASSSESQLPSSEITFSHTTKASENRHTTEACENRPIFDLGLTSSCSSAAVGTSQTANLDARHVYRNNHIDSGLSFFTSQNNQNINIPVHFGEAQVISGSPPSQSVIDDRASLSDASPSSPSTDQTDERSHTPSGRTGESSCSPSSQTRTDQYTCLPSGQTKQSPHPASGQVQTDQSPHPPSGQAQTNQSQTDRREMETQTSLNHGTLKGAGCEEGSLGYYKMDAEPRGDCLIINNQDFTHDPLDALAAKLDNREGSHLDVEKLEKSFKRLHFTTHVRLNLSDKAIIKELKRFSSKDHTAHDCFICCVLTHGGEGYVYGSNGRRLEIRDLVYNFRAQACPTLAEKPKMFFLVCCQGKSRQGGQPMWDVEADGPSPPRYIPNEADFLLAYATVPGYLSYRSRSRGTWYVSELTKALDEYAHRDNLQTLLLRVNQAVAEYEHSRTQEGGEEVLYKQVPAPQITLRKHLRFL